MQTNKKAVVLFTAERVNRSREISVGEQSSGTEDPEGGSYDGHFLPRLSAFAHRPKEGFIIPCASLREGRYRHSHGAGLWDP